MIDGLIDRKAVLLRAAYDILKKCNESPYTISAIEATAYWDDAECDGSCLLQEIADELGESNEDDI